MDATTVPCTWPINYSACGGDLPEPLASLPASGVATFEETASTYLWNWTGRKYGLCEVTVRPCRQGCVQDGQSTFWGLAGGVRSTPYYPVIIQGAWTNISCGKCGDDCGCDGTPALRLPGPVVSIEDITIDGDVLDPSAYRIDNDRLLVRMDGGAWPTCQNMSASGGEDTWSITYTRGTPVPVGGQVAAGLLANELAKAACNDKSCGLPQRVQSITRQGVTIAVLDAFDDIDTGHTGIWLIDSWVASIVRRPRKMRVYSPDRMPPRFRRQTFP